MCKEYLPVVSVCSLGQKFCPEHLDNMLHCHSAGILGTGRSKPVTGLDYFLFINEFHWPHLNTVVVPEPLHDHSELV